MRNDASDVFVRRVRVLAAGLACGLLVWCALRVAPQALAQTQGGGGGGPTDECNQAGGPDGPTASGTQSDLAPE